MQEINNQIGYKPVVQQSSDSELSEEELYTFYENGFQIITKNRVYSRVDNCERIENLKETPKMNCEDLSNRLKNLVERTTVWENIQCMTPLRKLSFATSIFLCVFSVIFLFSIPCDWANCKGAVKPQPSSRSIEWLVEFKDVEITGPIVVLPNGTFGDNILVMARGSMYTGSPLMRSKQITRFGGDIAQIDGHSGVVVWHKHYSYVPLEIDCSLLSILGNGSKECMFVAAGSNLVTFDSITGLSIWRLSWGTYEDLHKNANWVHDFPIVLPDLNGDNVHELALILNEKRLVVISGGDGMALHSSHENGNCTRMTDLHLRQQMTLSYMCLIKRNDSAEMSSLIDGVADVNSLPAVTQHESNKLFRDVYQHRNHTLFVKLHGGFSQEDDCPNVVEILDENNQAVWSHHSPRARITRPVTYTLNDGLYGFVVKFWRFPMEMETVELRPNKYNMTYRRVLEETLVTVFNENEQYPANTFMLDKTNFSQFFEEDPQKQWQPEFENQKDSMLVTDLNKDGSLELVSYYSTFEEKRTRSILTYTLKSYVRRYNLEMEIRKSLSGKNPQIPAIFDVRLNNSIDPSNNNIRDV